MLAFIGDGATATCPGVRLYQRVGRYRYQSFDSEKIGDCVVWRIMMSCSTNRMCSARSSQSSSTSTAWKFSIRLCTDSAVWIEISSFRTRTRRRTAKSCRFNRAFRKLPRSNTA
uniref:(northern house mosquito) hypothetical protein n=1 Tax=Culex pipiens TaxID=7175 RepID=A0A8D8G1N8_CULPI